MESVSGGYNGQINIMVSDPVKQGEGMHAYVSYKVTTKTSLPSFAPATELSVIRRYSDFDWLHAQMEKECPGAFLPPLAEKAVMGRFDPAFVEERKKSLEKYLMRVATHPELVSTRTRFYLYMNMRSHSLLCLYVIQRDIYAYRYLYLKYFKLFHILY